VVREMRDLRDSLVLKKIRIKFIEYKLG